VNVTSPDPRTVLVVGASRGIGAATVRLLVAQGHRVIAVARGREEPETFAKEVGAHCVAADATDTDQVDDVPAQCTAWTGDVPDVIPLLQIERS